MAQGVTDRCYHHKRNETSHHWPRPGRRSARRRAHGRADSGGPSTISGCRSPPASSGSGCRLPSPEFQPPEPRRRPGRSPRHDASCAICGPRQSFREPRRGRLFASLPPRGRHSLARSDRRLFSDLCAGLCMARNLARSRQLRSRPGPLEVSRLHRPRAGLSLPRHQLFLAGEPPFQAELVLRLLVALGTRNRPQRHANRHQADQQKAQSVARPAVHQPERAPTHQRQCIQLCRSHHLPQRQARAPGRTGRNPESATELFLKTQLSSGSAQRCLRPHSRGASA